MRRIIIFFAAVAAGCSPSIDDAGGADVSEESARHHVARVATLSYAPNSFVIGNAYPGWTLDAQGPPQFSSGPGNPNGADYRWGFFYGEHFDRCAWIDVGDLAGTVAREGNRCGARQEIDTPLFLATYTNGMHNHLAGDGSLTAMHWAGSGCVDRQGYGNVDPWRVPAWPANPIGEIPDGRALRWRYVSRDGEWVLVREPNATGAGPNWFFVHRGCVSLANAD